jgi:hypothetical protein
LAETHSINPDRIARLLCANSAKLREVELTKLWSSVNQLFSMSSREGMGDGSTLLLDKWALQGQLEPFSGAKVVVGCSQLHIVTVLFTLIQESQLTRHIIDSQANQVVMPSW